jgi:2-keto-4-pentenoate hydratase/2-oxohepta-3-ene-1,7-dioic acid hydratase in catechol pathway
LKLLCFNDDRLGVLKDDRVVDVSGTLPHRGILRLQTQVEDVIENYDSYRPKFEELMARESGIPVADVKLLPPIPRPRKVLAAFVNYQDRVGAKDVPIEFFYKNPAGMVGPDGTVELLDEEMVGVYHFEAELAFVMGKRAKHVSEADAMDYVFGYTPFIDVSARPAEGFQRRTQFIGKGQDTFCPMGPYLVTKDEIPDPHDLQVRLSVNEGPRQDYNTSLMSHRIPELIAWLTRYVTLEPGDVLPTGTYHVGLGPVNGGDVVDFEVEKLGRMRLNVKGFGPPKNSDWNPGGAPRR